MTRISTASLNETAINALMDQQTALSKTQYDLSTGLRVNTPADDPVAAAQIAQLTTVSASYTQYTSNGQLAGTNLNLESQALSTSTTTLQSIRDLVVQANSGSNNTADLAAIATQIQTLEGQLQGVANSQNAEGDYLFSGYSAGTEPFIRGSSGAMTYVGDSGAPSVQLDADTSVQTSDPGSSIYVNIPAGNGTFTVAASSSNTGTGVSDAGTVTDPSAWAAGQATNPGPYTITFTDPTDYTVTSSPVAPATVGTTVGSGTYDASTGGSVTFEGVAVGISGTPAAGDTFTVAPSGTEGVFTTLDKVVSALNGAGSSAASRAQLSSTLAESLQQIDQALNQISDVSSQVGARINLVSSVGNSLTSASTSVTTQISNLASLDTAAATSQYSQEYVNLQAAEQSYAAIDQLSLFKYL